MAGRYAWLGGLLWLLWGTAQAVVTWEQCQDLRPEGLHQALITVVQTQVASQQLAPDTALLERLWHDNQIDATLAAETDKAIAQIRANSSYWERYGSTWGSEASERFTVDIVNAVFGSAAFKEKLEQLMTAYGTHTQDQLAPILAQAWQQGHRCLENFVGARYGRALAQHFQALGPRSLTAAGQNLRETQLGGLSQHGSAATGVALVIGRRILQRMVQNLITRISSGVVSRIGGAIASRFIPVLGWGLLLYDFYAAADGILPEVGHVLKSKETRTAVLSLLEQGIREELLAPAGLAKQVADDIHNQWQTFRQRYQRLLTLADQHPEFAQVVQDLTPEQMGRFTSIISVLLEAVGPEATVSHAASGKVFQLMRLPPVTGDELLADTRSAEKTLQWYRQINESETKLATLLRLGVHRHQQPDDLSPSQLDILLTVDSKAAVGHLLSLDALSLDQTLNLPPDDLRALALRLDAAGWQTFAWYRQQLHPHPAAVQHFTQAVLQHPTALALFAPQATRLAILQAPDKIAAIDEIVGLSQGGWGKLLGGVLILLQWVFGLFLLWLLLRFWPLVRLLLQALWRLLRATLPQKPTAAKTVELETPTRKPHE